MNGLFKSQDGTQIYYEVFGKGRPLILCYGLLCRREHWKHQVAYFASRYQVIVPDYRGHQRSSIPSQVENLTLEWCARDILALMDFLGLEQAACMGHSVGVPILAHLASLEPERLKASVYVCGSVNNPFEQMLFTDKLDPLFEASLRVFEKAPAVVDAFWRSLTGKNAFSKFLAAQLGFNPEVAHPDDVESYLQGVHETPPLVFYRLMQDYRRVNRLPLLKKSNVPTLVIAGDEDCITPVPVQEEMVRLLKKGELMKVEGGSHNTHMDFPELVNQRIETFLNRAGYGCV